MAMFLEFEVQMTHHSVEDGCPTRGCQQLNGVSLLTGACISEAGKTRARQKLSRDIGSQGKETLLDTEKTESICTKDYVLGIVYIVTK